MADENATFFIGLWNKHLGADPGSQSMSVHVPDPGNLRVYGLLRNVSAAASASCWGRTAAHGAGLFARMWVSPGLAAVSRAVTPSCVSVSHRTEGRRWSEVVSSLDDTQTLHSCWQL